MSRSLPHPSARHRVPRRRRLALFPYQVDGLSRMARQPSACKVFPRCPYAFGIGMVLFKGSRPPTRRLRAGVVRRPIAQGAGAGVRPTSASGANHLGEAAVADGFRVDAWAGGAGGAGWGRTGFHGSSAHGERRRERRGMAQPTDGNRALVCVSNRQRRGRARDSLRRRSDARDANGRWLFPIRSVTRVPPRPNPLPLTGRSARMPPDVGACRVPETGAARPEFRNRMGRARSPTFRAGRRPSRRRRPRWAERVRGDRRRGGRRGIRGRRCGARRFPCRG